MSNLLLPDDYLPLAAPLGPSRNGEESRRAAAGDAQLLRDLLNDAPKASPAPGRPAS